MVSDVVISAAIRDTVNTVNRVQRAFDITSERLATGLEVNSATDNPQNFFAAQSLNVRAGDLGRLLDGIGKSIRVIEEALTGVEAIDRLLNQAESVVQESLTTIQAGNTDPAIFDKEVNVSPTELSRQIDAGNPDFYYRLNGTTANTGFQTSGGVASLNSGASHGGGALYTNGTGNDSVQFDGTNDRIRVSDSTFINTTTTTARTVELVFNADDVTGRQVLYEEGATVNGLTIYLDGDVLYVTGEDDQGAQQWNDANINSTQIAVADGGPVNIVAGQTYHAAFVYDAATNSFSGYLDGVLMNSVGTNGATNFPSHSGDIGIGGVNGGVQFHDGENNTGNGFNFDGRISDVAIYNRALSNSELASHANSLNASTDIITLNREYNTILEQIDRVVVDAQYQGINLLDGENLTTFFNPDNSTYLVTEGADFRWRELGLLDREFDTAENIQEILDLIRPAIEKVREFGNTLTNDLAIITNRRNFTEETINTLRSGADDLTLIDQNKEGAELLANGTRLSLAQTSLALAGQSQASTLVLFG